MAELCQFWDQTAAGEVRAETSDWRRDQTDRSRLRAPIGGFLQRNRKEVRLRFWSTGAIEDNSRGAPRRNTDTTGGCLLAAFSSLAASSGVGLLTHCSHHLPPQGTLRGKGRPPSTQNQLVTTVSDYFGRHESVSIQIGRASC